MGTLNFTKRYISNKIFTIRFIQLALFRKENRRNKSNGSFKFNDLQIKYASDRQKLSKPDPSSLTFGTVFSDHMFEVEWTVSDGWAVPKILPLHYFQLHPGSKVFHYAQCVFEGMKAFKYQDGKIALFRPELNMNRLLGSSERASLPSFDCNELLKCLKKLISIDREWVPGHFSSSLYIRPTAIGIENSLGVCSAKKSLLYIVTCPVGPYFKSGVTKPVSLLADPNYVRAFPGGAGSHKFGANYAPTLYVQQLAQEQGLDQVLWLIGEDNRVSEVGAMNVFFFLRNEGHECELVTPPLDGTILPGVVRQSILDLAREWKEFKVSERNITMSEVISRNKENNLLEMFVCGTACSMCPVKLIRFKGEDINIPTTTKENSIFSRFLTAITDIQYGRTSSEWSVLVE